MGPKIKVHLLKVIMTLTSYKQLLINLVNIHICLFTIIFRDVSAAGFQFYSYSHPISVDSGDSVSLVIPAGIGGAL